MEERHKQLLLKLNPWWQGKEFSVPLFKRNLFSKIASYLNYRQIIAVTGLRRTGKTILIKQIIQLLLERKTAKENICYLSFDDIGLQDYAVAGEIIDYFLALSSAEKRKYLFLDEIQKVPFWPDLLKTYYDLGADLKMVISGSAGLELEKSKETLAGRILNFSLPVLTFPEFCRYFGFKEKLDSKDIVREYDLKFLAQKERYISLFQDYLLRGGFPELLEIENEEFIKKYLKESIVEKVIFDVSKKSGETETIISQLFHLLAGSNAQLFEITNLAAALKINRNSLSHCLSLLEKAFLIKIGYNFTASAVKKLRVSKKQYLAHSSLVLAEMDYPSEIIRTDLGGHLVESTIAGHLEKFSFWRNPQKEEVDFIVQNKKVIPLEAKYKNQLLPRENRILLKFMAEYKIKTGVIITKDLFREEKIGQQKIIFIPAWFFLLCYPELFEMI